MGCAALMYMGLWFYTCMHGPDIRIKSCSTIPKEAIQMKGGSKKINSITSSRLCMSSKSFKFCKVWDCIVDTARCIAYSNRPRSNTQRRRRLFCPSNIAVFSVHTGMELVVHNHQGTTSYQWHSSQTKAVSAPLSVICNKGPACVLQVYCSVGRVKPVKTSAHSALNISIFMNFSVLDERLSRACGFVPDSSPSVHYVKLTAASRTIIILQNVLWGQLVHCYFTYLALWH